MSSSIILFGWIRSDHMKNIEEAMVSRWGILPIQSVDNIDRKMQVFNFSDEYSGSSIFNSSFELCVYDSKYSTAQRFGNPDIEQFIVSKVDISPISLHFDMFHRTGNLTGVAMYDKLKIICEIVDPIIIISMNLDTFYEIDNPTSESDQGFPLIKDLKKHCLGGICVSRQFASLSLTVDIDNIYRKIEYNAGYIMSSPFGFAYKSENPADYTDLAGKYYRDSTLEEILDHLYEPHMIEIKRILGEIY